MNIFKKVSHRFFKTNNLNVIGKFYFIKENPNFPSPKPSSAGLPIPACSNHFCRVENMYQPSTAYFRLSVCTCVSSPAMVQCLLRVCTLSGPCCSGCMHSIAAHLFFPHLTTFRWYWVSVSLSLLHDPSAPCYHFPACCVCLCAHICVIVFWAFPWSSLC